ncbi:hypothetical protein SCG7109_BB_00030 [Chlamydiales bacterium SCGC AG-110-M15]|nr:hypothetical protein SCG7109_BB_00030 [Chlamydiales bacterium SCGC AG-110-M15]
MQEAGMGPNRQEASQASLDLWTKATTTYEKSKVWLNRTIRELDAGIDEAVLGKPNHQQEWQQPNQQQQIEQKLSSEASATGALSPSDPTKRSLKDLIHFIPFFNIFVSSVLHNQTHELRERALVHAETLQTNGNKPFEHTHSSDNGVPRTYTINVETLRGRMNKIQALDAKHKMTRLVRLIATVVLSVFLPASITIPLIALELLYLMHEQREAEITNGKFEKAMSSLDDISSEY